MKVPVLQTERLILRPAHPRMAVKTAAFYTKNRDFLQPFEPKYDENFTTVAYQRALLRQDRQMEKDSRGVRLWLFPKEAPDATIGCVVLSNIILGSFRSCTLAYKIDRDHLRRGYATEAVLAAVELAFRGLGLHRVEANIMPRNQASLALARRCGFVEEGRSPKYLCINGLWEDHIHLARLQEEE